jgi:SAM-dependent methyltransferase
VVGVDKSAEQLKVARKRLPDSVPLYQMDMCDLSELDGSFDAVTCLFSSIGYMSTVENLHLAIAEMTNKLNPGGVLIVEPWLTPETYTVGSLHGDNVTNKPNLRISRMNIAEIIEEPGLPPRSFMEMHYLVGRPSGIERFREEHVLTLFTTEQYLEAISAAGLEARFDPDGLSDNGRGVFIGIKPT